MSLGNLPEKAEKKFRELHQEDKYFAVILMNQHPGMDTIWELYAERYGHPVIVEPDNALYLCDEAIGAWNKEKDTIMESVTSLLRDSGKLRELLIRD